MAFGPVPPSMTLADPIVLIGHRTCDTLPDIHTVKVYTVFSLPIVKPKVNYADILESSPSGEVSGKSA